jgi:autotransporter passenger strand-loop-strand repeat protein
MQTCEPQAGSAPTGAIILHPGDDISALVSEAPAGATFYFEPGVYRGVSLAPKDGQSFIGAEGAILNGSAVLTDWTQSGNLWVIGGQTQQGPVNPGAEFLPGTERPGNPETVFLDNTPLTPVDALSKVVPGTFYLDYATNNIYIADTPAGHTVEAGKLTDAFHGDGTNVTVQNLVIEKYDPEIQDGAVSAGQNWTIRDNEVRLNYAVGITAEDGSQIIGNYVHDNGQMGVGGDGNNILVQGNELASNGFWSGIDPLWEAGGLKFTNTDNLIVRGNYSHDNNGSGLWGDIDNINALYENNVVVHNTINGISYEISYDAIIRNNILVGNGYGDTRGWGWGADINIQNSQNVQVYGNRVDMTGGGNGIVLIQQDRGSGAYGPYTTTGNQIHDNVIVDRDGQGSIGGFADYDQSGMLDGGNTWSNNQYFMSDGGDRFQWDGPETFAQFQAAAHETGSISQSYPDTSGWPTPACEHDLVDVAHGGHRVDHADRYHADESTEGEHSAAHVTGRYDWAATAGERGGASGTVRRDDLLAAARHNGAERRTRRGGRELLLGGDATSTVSSSGAQQVVDSGGEAVGTFVSSGGFQLVSSGSASATTLDVAAQQDDFADRSATSTTVASGGFQVDFGSAFATSPSADAIRDVLSNALASGATVSSGAIDQEVPSGDLTNGTFVSGLDGASAIELLDANGVGSNTSVGSGGTTVSAVISSVGSELVFSGGTASDTTVSGDVETVFSGGTLVGATISGGSVEIESGGTAGSSLITISSGTPIPDQAQSFDGTVAGLAISGVQDIDPVNVAFTNLQTLGYSDSGALGTPIETDGSVTAQLNLIGTYTAGSFLTSADGAGGTIITDSPVSSGTGIAAPL